MNRDYFTRMYDGAADPWRLASTPYELAKFEHTVQVLDGRRFTRAFEPGCSIGVLTERLADHCDDLLAWDVAPAAVERARTRVRHPGVRFAVGDVPGQWPGRADEPEGPFDLVVVSELGYFLEADERTLLRDRVADSLTGTGLLLAVHWRHPFEEAPSDGGIVHAELHADPRLLPLRTEAQPDYLIDLFRRR